MSWQVQNTTYVGNWYIRVSSWDKAHSSTSSVAVGKWHVGRDGTKIQEGAKKRFSYVNGLDWSRDEAIEKAREWIQEQEGAP